MPCAAARVALQNRDERSVEYRKLADTGMEVSVVALGCWAFAGDEYWGPQDDRDSIASVHAALDEGVNFFDTAEGYGSGHSERVLGRALKGRRHEAVIATKCSHGGGSAAEVEAACARSLQQLETDYIDLYQIHWPFRETPLEETLSAFERLKRQGKIRAVGVCNFGARDLAALAEVGHCATNQVPYSLLTRAIEFEIQAHCIERDIGIICYTPLAQGLLTGRYATVAQVPAPRAISRHFASGRAGARHGEEGCETEVFAALRRIGAIARDLETSMAAVALAWVCQQAGVTSLLTGARTPEELRENARGAALVLDARTVRALDEVTRQVKKKLGANADLWRSSAQSRIR